MTIKIRVSKKPNFIIVSVYANDIFQYWVNSLDSVNKYCDIGVWRIKYKS